jgi:hypothetical protein
MMEESKIAVKLTVIRLETLSIVWLDLSNSLLKLPKHRHSRD